MKQKVRQLEIDWSMPEPFALALAATLDGERIAKEAQEKEADRKEAEQRQTELV